MQAPLLLLWGVLDPWIGAGSADRIQRYYPSADRVELQAGHCPQVRLPAALCMLPSAAGYVVVHAGRRSRALQRCIDSMGRCAACLMSWASLHVQLPLLWSTAT